MRRNIRPYLPEMLSADVWPPFAAAARQFNAVHWLLDEDQAPQLEDYVVVTLDSELIALRHSKNSPNKGLEIVLQRPRPKEWHRHGLSAYIESRGVPRRLGGLTVATANAKLHYLYAHDPSQEFADGKVTLTSRDLGVILKAESQPRARIDLSADIIRAELLPVASSMLLSELLNNLNIESAGRELALGSASNP